MMTFDVGLVFIHSIVETTSLDGSRLTFRLSKEWIFFNREILSYSHILDGENVRSYFAAPHYAIDLLIPCNQYEMAFILSNRAIFNARVSL
jgi:hypothetical protein